MTDFMVFYSLKFNSISKQKIIRRAYFWDINAFFLIKFTIQSDNDLQSVIF